MPSQKSLGRSLPLIAVLAICQADCVLIEKCWDDGGGSVKVKPIGPDGGSVQGLGGSTAVVPPGATDDKIRVEIQEAESGYPDMPADVEADGPVYSYLPHGAEFNQPVTVRIPCPNDEDTFGLYTAQPDGSWESVPGARQRGGFIEADVTHFSFFFAGTPRPVTVAPGQDGPVGITIYQDTLLWANREGGEIMKLGLPDGEPEVLCDTATGPEMVVASFQGVFWSNAWSGSLYKTDLDGGVPDQMSTGVGQQTSIAVAPNWVFFTGDGEGDSVFRVGTLGGPPVPIQAGLARPAQIIAEYDTIYWTNFGTGSNGSVMKASRWQGTPFVLADGLAGPWGITIDETHVYWTDGRSGEIKAVAKTGGPVTSLASGAVEPMGIAVDEHSVYWTDVAAGTVMAVPKAGGAAVRLAKNQEAPMYLAVDDSSVYWTSHDAGLVLKAPKAAAMGAGADATGGPCLVPQDCPAGVCVGAGQQTGFCSTTCVADADCVAGWTCSSVEGYETDVCTCGRGTERCDGVDNDCDGFLDEGQGADVGCAEGARCLVGLCVCDNGGIDCDGTCLDVFNDHDHCGGCASQCQGAETCVGGTCMCVGAGQVCDGTCRDTDNDRENCDGCDVTCQVACEQGQCVVVVQAAAGARHACAILEGGSVRCWGNNDCGQTGQIGFDVVTRPKKVEGLPPATQVSAGNEFTCALTQGGQVYCWGLNTYGQLGNGEARDVPIENPTPTMTLLNDTAIQIAAGWTHACALLDTGRIACWGESWEGAAGTGGQAVFTTPVYVQNINTAVQVAAGGDHTCAVLTDGTVWCWGQAFYGQLGYGGSTDNQYRPVQVSGLTGAVQVDCGYSHTCVTKTDGTVWCFGYNNFYQCGRQDRSNIQTPYQVNIANARKVTTSRFASFGFANSWDATYWGTLPDGTYSYNPYDIWGGSARDITSTYDFYCVLDYDGGLYCWGDNDFGQLGADEVGGPVAF